MNSYIYSNNSYIQPTPLELTCLSYEYFFQQLLACIHSSDDATSTYHLSNACSMLDSLIQSLNLELSLAHSLLSLYTYVQSILQLPSPSKDELLEVHRIMKPVAEGYFTLRSQEVKPSFGKGGFEA